MSEEIRDLVRRYLAAIDAGDHEAIAGFFAPDGERVHVTGVTKGREAIRAKYASNHGAFTERQHTRGPIMVDGNTAIIEYKERALHSGTFKSDTGDVPATNRYVDITGCMVIDVTDEGFSSVRLYSDTPYRLMIMGQASNAQ